MSEERQRYSDSDLMEFKELIQSKIEKAEKEVVAETEVLDAPAEVKPATEEAPKADKE